VAYFLAGLTMFAIPLAGGAAWMAFTLLFVQQFFGDGLEIVQEINVTSLAQTITPRGQLGRVNASFLLASHGTVSLGAVVAGIAASAIGVRETLFIAVAGVNLGLLWLLLSPLPRIRTAVAPAANADGAR
jgi:predicted MFS family arabinose efflux permease